MPDYAPSIRVGERIISSEHPAFIVAEAACNHLCDMDNALKMIDEAAGAGADAIKFQTYTADKLTTKKAGAYGNISTASQYDYYRQFDRFGRAEYEELFDHARQNGIIAFSTPFDPGNAQMLNSLQMPLFKIASCDIPYTDLFKVLSALRVHPDDAAQALPLARR